MMNNRMMMSKMRPRMRMAFEKTYIYLRTGIYILTGKKPRASMTSLA